MLFSSVITSALLVAGATLAQGATGTTSSAGTAPTGSVSVTVVKIGDNNGSLVIEPNSLHVEVGSMIQFQFHPKNHSVVRSTFDQPCVPIEQSQPGSKVGFFSGFMPVKDTMGTFTIWVADKNPIWFYCSQAKHCQNGMVGVINPPASNSSKNIDTFKALAAKAPANISPSGNSTIGNSGSNTYSNTLLPTSGTPPSATSTKSVPVATANAAADTIRVGGTMAIVAFGMALLA